MVPARSIGGCTKPKLMVPFPVVRHPAPPIAIPEFDTLSREQSDKDQDTNWARRSSENAATLAAAAKIGPARDGGEDSCSCSK